MSKKKPYTWVAPPVPTEIPFQAGGMLDTRKPGSFKIDVTRGPILREDVNGDGYATWVVEYWTDDPAIAPPYRKWSAHYKPGANFWVVEEDDPPPVECNTPLPPLAYRKAVARFGEPSLVMTHDTLMEADWSGEHRPDMPAVAVALRSLKPASKRTLRDYAADDANAVWREFYGGALAFHKDYMTLGILV